jgi:hypothetical protein
MKNRMSRKRSLALGIFLENTSQRKGQELKRYIARQIPEARVRSDHFYVAFRAAGPGDLPELVHEILVFISAHKETLTGIAAYPAGKVVKAVTKKMADIIANKVAEWAKPFKKHTYRVLLYGPDGEPVKGVEIEGGEQKGEGPWKDYARERGISFKERMK